MAWLSLAIIVITSCLIIDQSSAAYDWNVQRLNQFQAKYNNSRSDIIFMLDVSGSLSRSAFNIQKEFVKSLLSKISVQPIATRVAVVTFGQNIYTNIDYIDYDRLDKNKCTFTKAFQGIHHKYEGATNMNGALQRGKDILDSAKKHGNLRDNVNTVAILITDGGWNAGGSPYSTASTLKDRSKYDVEIFTVGVGWADKNALKQIASANDKALYAATFSQFSNLATRIRGDQIELLYQAVDKTLCGITCDPRAACSCGTISGIYTCACGPGYFGSGSPGECTKCNFGTYKTFPSPDPCKPCPANSQTTIQGATSLYDCVCKVGYEGNPALNQPCTIVKCPALPATIANGVVTNCGRSYEETCTFTCDTNHHIENEDGTTRKLVCQKTGRWSMTTPVCKAIRCQWASQPPHATVSCSGDKVGDKCTYSCDAGYRLNGTNVRECRATGYWSHTLPTCTVVKCPPLRQVTDVDFLEPKCLTESTDYPNGCAFACKIGYKRVSGSISRKCEADGTWSGTELVCKDLTPPSITCQSGIVAETDIHKAYKAINFTQPVVNDNSLTKPGAFVDVIQTPSSIISPYEFPIGVTWIHFSAIDQAGNNANCTLRVEIKDREKPRFTYCPSDIKVITQKGSDTSAVVNWTEPVYTDNSGQVSLLTQSMTSPQTVVVGPKVLVKYVVQDAALLTSICQFFVQVEAKTCPERDPPLNGATSCSPYVANFGTSCSALCNDQYEPNGPRAYIYLCNVQGVWAAIPPNVPSMWPDCTVLATPEGMSQRVALFYYSGDCHTSLDARNQIADNFIKIFDKFLQSIHQGGCADPANSRLCQASNVDIKCGALTGPGARRRRSSQANAFTMTMDVEVRSHESADQQKKAVEDLTKGISQVTTLDTPEAKSLQSISVGSDTLTLNAITTVGSITGVCTAGQVFGVVQQQSTAKAEKCIACLAGRYYSRKEKVCKDCPKATYTETPGRLGCSNCPLGTTTINVASSKKTSCRARCLKGTFSKTGLATCNDCPKGFYQPDDFAKSCLKCPGSTTTKATGAADILECGMICSRGTYSESGVEPCLPCPRGYYQDKFGQIKCIQCKDPLYTYGTGATDPSQCTVVKSCQSNPCLNGAVCHNEANSFRCQCQPGFNGINCEIEVNECANNPCYGKSVCVDKVNGFKCVCPAGYTGIYCADRVPECTAGLCQNGGVCHDTDEGFSCSCKAGWTGSYCESKINECASSPCLNNGYCVDSHNGFSCQCKDGFKGLRCEINIDECEKNNLCLNGASCVDGINDFHCACAPGFDGPRCNVNIDECASNPCRNNGECVDEVNGYMCVCASTFYGTNCDKRETDVTFDLEFTRGVQGYANKTLYHDMKQFSLVFWIKASEDDVEAGTIASYSVEENGKFNDNAIVLRDYNHFLLVVNNKEVETRITANDGKWHHVAVTWNSADGSYKAFKDGLKTASGTNFQLGQTVTGGGVFVLGQEQDEVGRNFSASEAFAGSVSQLNFFDTILSDQEIAEMSRYRCNGVLGNVIAWPDFLRAKTDIKKTNSFCTVQNVRFHPWSNKNQVKNGIESEPSDCAGKATMAHCVSVNGFESVKDSSLNGVVCGPGGYTCRNADQQVGQNQPYVCVDYQARFECPYTGGNNCASSPCLNGGTCIDTLQGYRCLCTDGNTGKNCDTMVPCHKIATFANGQVTQSGNSATFTCNSGFQIQGASQLQCSGGKWNAAVPKCVDVNECSTNNGGCNHQCVNKIGSFRCICSSKFRFDGQKCVDFDECSVNNGNCQGYCHNSHGGSTCRCQAGYKLGLDMTSCQDSNECLGTNSCEQVCVNKLGTYDCACNQGFTRNADKKTCSRLSCPALTNPTNGAVSQTSKDFESEAVYTCNSGYRINGPTSRHCQADTGYSGNAPTCQFVECGVLGTPFNGQSTKTGTSFGKAYSFTCLSGYLLQGSAKRVCRQSGLWSGTQPRCVPYHCSPLSAPNNGQIIGTSLIESSSVIIHCNTGYQLDDPNNNYRTCQSDKSWSGSAPTCVIVNCGAPTTLVNGTITGSVHTYQAEIEYKCNKNSGLSGPSKRICQANGKWSGIEPTCLFHSCGYPSIPSNGQIDSQDFSFGSTITYSCAVGYALKGPSKRLCLDEGIWSDSTPTCERISCGDPGTPTNGERLGTDFSYQAKLVFDCMPGYSLVGSRFRACELSGQWTGAQPTCVSGKCGSGSLVGPSGSVKTPNYPSNYEKNLYCRWGITVANSKLASVTIKDLKIETGDQLEVRDGNRVITILTGVLPSPIAYTSSSNKIDLRFLSDGNQVASASGFDATYSAAVCGGFITAYGDTISSPGFLTGQYPPSTTCVWEISSLDDSFEVSFQSFQTQDVHDKLVAYKSITDISSNTFIGSYYGFRGSFKITTHTGSMYLKFSSDAFHETVGFKATVNKLVRTIG